MIGVNKGLVGGYFLLKEPGNISVYDIIILMESKICIIEVSDKTDTHSTLHEALIDLQNRIYHYLKSLTLEVLIHKTWPECLEHLTDILEPYYEVTRSRAALEF
jgi:DNA-binding IscR family transcriptional regulator